MKKAFILTVVIFFCSALLLASCSPREGNSAALPASPGPDAVAPAPSNSVPAGPEESAVARPTDGSSPEPLPAESAKLEKPVYGETDEASQAVARGANDFAFRLSAALVQDTSAENFVCSPYSVWLPLAALLEATDGASKEALLEALGAQGLTEADVKKAASRMLYDLSNLGGGSFEGEAAYNPLQIANAIFVDQDVTLQPAFAQDFADCFLGQAMNVDFADPSAADTVNRWASDHTDGLIGSIVQEFDPATAAAIANAIYFSDRWDWEFDADQTAEGVFYASGGEVAADYMLREGTSLPYYEDDALQAMPLAFKTGGGMYILLPKDGDAEGLLASMDMDYFSGIQQGTAGATGKLLLPRFSLESDVMDMTDALISLGVPLFDAEKAPLTGGLIEEDIPVWVSGAVQKAMIDVDEKGTTAAAVTVMPVAGAGLPEPTEPFEMVCDKPFAFVLYGSTYDGGAQVLFTGIVGNPAEGGGPVA